MLFMNTPYWRAVEREMQTIPNFKPRCSGFRINGVMLENLISYESAAEKLLRRWKREDIADRISEKYRELQTPYADKEHEEYFGKIIKEYPFNGSRYYAAIFVLSARNDLREHLKTAVRHNSIDFKKIGLKGISPDGYVLFKAAKAFLNENAEILPDELFDAELVNDLLLYIIFNGFLIIENGVKILRTGDAQ